MEAKLGRRVPADRPRLAVVGTDAASPERYLDDVERESRIRWLRALARAYRHVGMDLIVKQALVGKRWMDDLSDDELLALHRDMDRARECLSEGITFEDAGLIRSHG